MTDKLKSGDGETTELLSLYLYYAEQTEKFIERRAANSRYFLTVNTAFVTLLALAVEHRPEGAAWWVLAVPLAGIVTCVVWARLTQSYRVLTGAKFEVIGELEAKLAAAPYTEEWRHIEENPDYRTYASISKLERVVPWVFVAIYLVLIAATVVVGSLSY